ncbi:hypothetical protein LGT39_10370 [Demequina sp. TTPB684]|uniref:hypothetical protein n=1 Tax=Demequina sp. TTPB684 TaxID=2881057 RepID=UPI001CF179CB|nr:hypothetical protein [Demequina sp. TTPB684]MCB2413246.1 hypothetical protein [Demequina sp. TTPB684]
MDILADAFGGDDEFSVDRVQGELALGCSLLEFLALDNGPSQILDRIFVTERRDRRSRHMPSAAEAVAMGSELDHQLKLELGSVPEPTSPVRPVRRLGSID